MILSKDENLIVRQTCFESLLDLRNQFNDSKSIEQVSEMIIALTKFGLASKMPKFLLTIALRLADLCHTLTGKIGLRNISIYYLFSSEVFRSDEYEFIHEIFIRLSQENVSG